MELISFGFIAFVCVVIGAYYLMGRLYPRAQWITVLGANVAFCLLAGSIASLAFVFICAIPTWLASHAFTRLTTQAKAARKTAKDRSERKAIKRRLTLQKRAVLVTALAVALGVLCYLKYWNVILFNFGFANSPTSLGILLPLGISFYTFQSISYLVDTYNDKFAPEPNFARYLTFVCYFPSFIQGPINHYDVIAPQLSVAHKADLRGAQRALLRIGLGLFKKIAIANMLTANVNVLTSGAGATIPGSAAALGVLLYSFQMYGDFSGGIDIVEGVSELLGIEMQPNFRQPYLSTSLADFWRRWHMSLGVLMRDYVFYPIAVTKAFQRFGKWCGRHLGKHAGRTLPACVANVIVFIFVGLWHGAEWHYIAWGLYNGIIVALSDLFHPVFDKLNTRLGLEPTGTPRRVIAIIRTFIVVNIGRYFDCITDVGASFASLGNLALYFYPAMGLRTYLDALGVTNSRTFGMPRSTLVALIMLFIIDLSEEHGTDVRDWLLSKRFAVRLLIYLLFGAIISATFSTTVMGGASFLYANF